MVKHERGFPRLGQGWVGRPVRRLLQWVIRVGGECSGAPGSADEDGAVVVQLSLILLGSLPGALLAASGGGRACYALFHVQQLLFYTSKFCIRVCVYVCVCV